MSTFTNKCLTGNYQSCSSLIKTGVAMIFCGTTCLGALKVMSIFDAFQSQQCSSSIQTRVCRLYSAAGIVSFVVCTAAAIGVIKIMNSAMNRFPLIRNLNTLPKGSLQSHRKSSVIPSAIRSQQPRWYSADDLCVHPTKRLGTFTPEQSPFGSKSI